MHPIHIIYASKILKPKQEENDSLARQSSLTHGSPQWCETESHSGPAKVWPHSGPQTAAMVGGFQSGLLPGGGLPPPGGRWGMISQCSSSLKGQRKGLETAQRYLHSPPS